MSLVQEGNKKPQSVNRGGGVMQGPMTELQEYIYNHLREEKVPESVARDTAIVSVRSGGRSYLKSQIR